MTKKSKMLSLVQLIAECHDTEITESRAALIEYDLNGCTLDEVNDAWRRYRSVPTNTRMPTAAQLIQYIPDGHPSAQESFAMIPRNEYTSVIWSDEMRFAYGVCESLIREGNITGAFFAYKEEYDRLVQESRMKRRKPKWSPSFGDDKAGREVALVTAIEKKRISLDLACKFYPELEWLPSYEKLALTYGGTKLEIDYKNIEEIKKLIQPKEIK